MTDYSEISINDGLMLEGDSTPLSSTLDTSILAMYDNDYNTAVSGYFSHYNAYGLDFGSSKSIDKIICYCVTNQSSRDCPYWYPGGANIFGVYSSNDNSTWTLEETFDKPTIISHGLGLNVFEIVLASTINSRYVKVRKTVISGYAQVSINGTSFSASLYLAEMEAFVYSVTFSGLLDFPLDLEVQANDINDIQVDISAFYQEILDIKLDISMVVTSVFDLPLDIFISLLCIDDLSLDLFLTNEISMNILLDIYLVTGLFYYNFALDIAITNGINSTDLSLDIMTITQTQIFKAVYGIQLNSVLEDVTP